MQQYVERMITEKKDLEGKIKKAQQAIDSNPYGMDVTQKDLLCKQLGFMKNYLDCLNKRLEYERSK